jgi:hypothetical protein
VPAAGNSRLLLRYIGMKRPFEHRRFEVQLSVLLI